MSRTASGVTFEFLTLPRSVPLPRYDILADVTRAELNSDKVRCEWLNGATSREFDSRFKAVIKQRRGRNWTNKPVITKAVPRGELTFASTEPFAETVYWRYRFETMGVGTSSQNHTT